jgi:predicted transcriptional regulator
VAKFLLKNTSLINLIKKVLGETREGYLLFEQDSEWKKLFFSNGKVIGASSSNKSDYLGQYLVSYGVIDISQFDKTSDTELNPGKIMKIALETTNSETLKKIVSEKIIDTIFLAARWEKCVCSVVEERTFKSQVVSMELSIYDIAEGLKKSIDEFRSVLEIIPKLGARPGVNSGKSGSYKFPDQKETILNYLAAGKTISEILSIIPSHNYLLFRSLLNLFNEGAIEKGTGFPLSREDIVRFVDESGKYKKSSQTVSDVSLGTFRSPSEDGSVKNNDTHLEAISRYQELYREDPDNSAYSSGYVQVKSSFVADFYKNKLSPFAVIQITGDIRNIADINEIDTEVYMNMMKEGGRISLKNIIKSMENRNEIDVLRSLDKFMDGGAVKDVEPETFIDAIKFGRNEHLQKLFKESEKNKFFKMDIPKDASPLMFSLISGTISCESSEEEMGLRSENGRNDLEMTFLMFASMTNNYEAVEFLLSQNVDINLHSGNGVTALMLALQNGYDNLAWLLLGSGADVNAKNTSGYSALMIAASKGLSHVVDRMIRLGADVNQVNSNGQTALSSAIKFNHKDVVVGLIAAGASRRITDSKGRKLDYYACSDEMKELISKGSRKSIKIKKKQDEQKKDFEACDKNIFKNKRAGLPGLVPIVIFFIVLFATLYISVSVLFFSGENYGLTMQSRRVVKELGVEYCEKFKMCRDDLPGHILAKCNQMGTEIMSENFRDAKSCENSLIQNCILCIHYMTCKDFYRVNGSNLFQYCSQCRDACRYR